MGKKIFNYSYIALEILLNIDKIVMINLYTLYLFSVLPIDIKNVYSFLPFNFPYKNNKDLFLWKNYSTKLEIEKGNKLNPWYITGYSVGDSAFWFSIVPNNKLKMGA